MEELDDLDVTILRLLQENAHYTNKEIAARLGMTITPVYERIKRLENQGYIKKYITLLDKEKIGKTLTSFCSVSLRHHTKDNVEQFEKEIQQFNEVQECYHVAGATDFLLKVTVKNMSEYHDFVRNKLSTIENIGNLNSSFVLNEIKYTLAYDI
ncbi:Lrp/AsnC family transcriptional regulator [Cytophagaceae bacterium DM2B3-1]|uniref:Lrp/AsnC family transcriptional regulator n=2 Tax=Xanthocytophaga TaxID=3078918 RepID=A0AAE3QR09_9BACT|nr:MULTISPECIES: Lrp/AsnC family transcriptional regulator [Xanthocytophaga]MDJ1469492.1 Lrp/AsnC family transcriptional regulator [Xanthocytophaga flavus]MDJ1483892.1 Lrp/AsnC family transcriptional regulator [Xanthocytophaga flavus]MDJ1493995.1 Lrp/AsnC family transcriptional regulator [Xanthocytophaga flavus]MDJ1506696.1 Lrp/AsnC family transcriptional regulator [Xanthocytophaga agilis]